MHHKELEKQSIWKNRGKWRHENGMILHPVTNAYTNSELENEAQAREKDAKGNGV